MILIYFGPQALRGRSLGEGEGVSYYLPMRVQVAQAWRDGEWPGWNPYAFGGMPLLADCQAGALYPFNLLYLVLEPIPAMNVVILSGHILAAWGMVLLLRRLRVSAWASGLGASVFVFSGFMIAHMGHVTIVNAAVWLPWLAWSLHRWCARRSALNLAALVLFWTVQILAGHPQIVLYCGIILGMCLIGWSRSLLTWAGVLAAGVLAVMLCGIQLVPTMELSAQTGRNFEPQFWLFENYRFSILYTPLLWLPYLFGTQAQTPLGNDWWGDWNFVEQAGYLGLLPWMLIPAAIGLSGGRQRGARLFAIIALVNLVLAWNTDTAVGRALFHLPIYNSFEAAGRHLLGVIFGLAVCAGMGLDALSEATKMRARRWASRGIKPVVFVVVAIIVAAIWGYEYGMIHLQKGLHFTEGRPLVEHRPWMLNPWMLIAPLVIASLSAWGLSYHVRSRCHRSMMILTTIVMLDVLSAGYFCAWRWRHEGNYKIAPPDARLAALLAPTDTAEPPPRYLLYGNWPLNYSICPQGNMLYDFASMNGYGPFQSKRFHTMLDGAVHHDGQTHDSSVLEPSLALDLWACRYVVVRSDASYPPLLDETQYRPVLALDDVIVYENVNALPSARWGDGQDAPSDEAELLHAIQTGQRASTTTQPANDDIQWLAYTPNRLQLKVRTDRPRQLVLSEPFDEGWCATLDDRTEIPIHQADYMLRMMEIPPGEHTVELHYRPPSRRKGGMISAAGAVGFATTLVGMTWIQRRRRWMLSAQPSA